MIQWRTPRVLMHAISSPQNWGYSHKIGPVYLNDREDAISPKKKDEIEDEVRRYVISHVICPRCPCVPPSLFAAHAAVWCAWEVSDAVYGGQSVPRLTDFVLVALVAWQSTDSGRVTGRRAPEVEVGGATSGAYSRSLPRCS